MICHFYSIYKLLKPPGKFSHIYAVDVHAILMYIYRDLHLKDGPKV